MIKYLAILALFPLLLKSPALLGWNDANPMLTFGMMGLDVHYSSIPGAATIDPNNAFTTQALGMRAAKDWWHGHVPWWNPYEGTGIPLAGEMQSAAFFLPFILVMAWPAGLLWFHLSLQILAGLATFALLRRLGLVHTAALVGGLLYEVNGAFAWISNAAINPIPFLPLLLYGVETAWQRASQGKRGGWAWITAAVTWSLYAGFPETAYIDGLLAGVWSLVRLSQSSWPTRRRLLGKLCSGCFTGILLSLPIIVPFAHYVLHSFDGGHSENAFESVSLPMAGLTALFFPYVYGPIFGSSASGDVLGFWYSVGGYAGSALPLLALWALWGRQERALRWALAGWVVIAWLRTFGQPWAAAILNHVPLLALTAFFRYSVGSWILCLVILAAFTLDDICRGKFNRWNYTFTTLAGITFLAGTIWPGWPYLRVMTQPTLLPWLAGSFGLAGITCLFLVGAPHLPKFRMTALALSAVVLAEAALLFITPFLANPLGGQVDTAGLAYLSQSSGLQRFYTLGPIQPNFGSAYGIAQINWNDLPVEKDMTDYMHQHLDPYSYPDSFTGHDHQESTPEAPSPADVFREHVHDFEQAGVGYLVTTHDFDPDVIASPVQMHDNQPLALQPNESCQIDLASVPKGTLETMGILIGTYMGKSNGSLHIRVSQGSASTEGSRPLKDATDNGVFQVTFSKELRLQKGPATVVISHDGGDFQVALWLWPLVHPGDQVLHLSSGTAPELGASLQWGIAKSVAAPVYSDSLLTIYPLLNPRPYFTAPGCELTVQDRNSARVNAPQNSHLTRLETYYEGWTATVNGKPVPIDRVEGLFQQIPIPAGVSQVNFTYLPPYFGWTMLGFSLGALIFAWEVFRSFASKPSL